MTYNGHPYMVSNCRECPFGRGGFPITMNVACDLAINENDKCVHTSDKQIPVDCPMLVTGGIKIEITQPALDDALARLINKKS